MGPALTSLGAQLGGVVPAFARVQWRRGVVTLTTAEGRVTGSLTAPRTLVCALPRRSAPVLGLTVWRPEPGARDAVWRALQLDGAAHDGGLTLARTLRDAGAQEEAQLAWSAADSLLTTEDEGGFFPRWPGAARVLAGSSASAPSLVEKLLPYLKSKSSLEACLASEGVAWNVGAALFDLAQRPVQPARAAKLTRNLELLLPKLEGSKAPAVKEEAHLLRWPYMLARDLHG